MMKFPKMEPFRSKLYRRYVASLPSVVSERPSDDPHHIKRPGFGGTVKCSDLFCIPLTRDEHDEFHRMGWCDWEELHGNQMEHALRTIERAFRDGFFQEINT